MTVDHDQQDVEDLSREFARMIDRYLKGAIERHGPSSQLNFNVLSALIITTATVMEGGPDDILDQFVDKLLLMMSTEISHTRSH